jgi:hypothetical protein
MTFQPQQEQTRPSPRPVLRVMPQQEQVRPQIQPTFTQRPTFRPTHITQPIQQLQPTRPVQPTPTFRPTPITQPLRPVQQPQPQTFQPTFRPVQQTSTFRPDPLRMSGSQPTQITMPTRTTQGTYTFQPIQPIQPLQGRTIVQQEVQQRFLPSIIPEQHRLSPVEHLDLDPIDLRDDGDYGYAIDVRRVLDFGDRTRFRGQNDDQEDTTFGDEGVHLLGHPFPQPGQDPEPEVIVVEAEPVSPAEAILRDAPEHLIGSTEHYINPELAPAPVEATDTGELHDCPICMDDDNQVAGRDLLVCGHALCVNCLSALRQTVCPCCRQPLAGPLLTNRLLADITSRQREDELEREDVSRQIAAALERNPNANMDELYTRYN